MATKYPNRYYEQLAKLMIENPSLPLKAGEVCFYQGTARSFETHTETTKKPKKKTSFFWTPWFWGIKRKKEVIVEEKTETRHYSGKLYLTNMRMVFKCAVDGFDLTIPSITEIKRYRDGFAVVSRRKSYKVKTSDVTEILHIVELMNKAQA